MSINKDKLVKQFREFILFCAKHLELKKIPKITWYTNGDVGAGQPSFGAFQNSNQTIKIGITNRHPIDIMRTLAHELTHYKQFIDGKIKHNSGDTGSAIENEANATAGIIMRNWGQKHPDMFKEQPITEVLTLRGSGNLNDKAKKWIEKVNTKIPANPLDPSQRTMIFNNGEKQEVALFELVPSATKPGAVEIQWFQAYPMKTGVGTKAMKKLQDMATEDNISLTLFPWGKGSISQAKLIKIYKSMGFKPIKPGDKNMIWVPEASLTESVTAYHGSFTPNIRSKRFRALTHFGSEKAAQDRLAFIAKQNKIDNTGRVYQVELDINNPAIIKDAPVKHSTKQLAFALKAAKIFTQDEMTSVTYKTGVAATKQLIKLLKSKGYDGLAYKNKYEDKGHTSYIILDPTQARILRKNANTLKESTAKVVDRVINWLKSPFIDEAISDITYSIFHEKDIVNQYRDVILNGIENHKKEILTYFLGEIGRLSPEDAAYVISPAIRAFKMLGVTWSELDLIEDEVKGELTEVTKVKLATKFISETTNIDMEILTDRVRDSFEDNFPNDALEYVIDASININDFPVLKKIFDDNMHQFAQLIIKDLDFYPDPDPIVFKHLRMDLKRIGIHIPNRDIVYILEKELHRIEKSLSNEPMLPVINTIIELKEWGIHIEFDDIIDDKSYIIKTLLSLVTHHKKDALKIISYLRNNGYNWPEFDLIEDEIELTETDTIGLDQVAGIGIAGKSYRFKIKDLINKAKHYPVKSLNPKIFKQQLDDIDEPARSKKQRTDAAELKYPIIVVKHGNILHIADGTHRARKALLQGLKLIKAHIIPLTDMDDFLSKEVVDESDTAIKKMSVSDTLKYLKKVMGTASHEDWRNHIINTNDYFELKNVPVNSLKSDLSGLNLDNIEKYKKMDFLKAPPIVIGSDGNILDGYHRVNVAKALKIPTLKAWVGVKKKESTKWPVTVSEAKLIPNEVYQFIEELSPDDVGVHEVAGYRVHFEGFTDWCNQDAEDRCNLPKDDPKYIANYDDIYDEVLHDFISKEHGVQPVKHGMSGSENNPIVWAIWPVTVNEAKLTYKDPVETWIKRFKASTNPRFKGKNPDQREKMARAAQLKAVQNKKFTTVTENNLLDKPTPSIADLAEKYHTSIGMIHQELDKGIEVEMEHTNKPNIAMEIALDHLNEDLWYYKKLAKIEKSNEIK